MKIMQNSDVPIYRQIASQFKDDIMNGRIGEGEYLPSIRGLAKDLKISVITTAREQQLRLLEQHLQNAMEAAKLAGVSRDELVEMLKVLYDTD